MVCSRAGWQCAGGADARLHRAQHLGAVPAEAARRRCSADLPQWRSAYRDSAVKHKPPETFFYLPKAAEDLLVSCIRNRFDIDMWTSLSRFVSVMKRTDELIYAFMEKNGIDMTETNWNAIAKRYQRKRNSYKAYERVKKIRKNRSDLKG